MLISFRFFSFQSSLTQKPYQEKRQQQQQQQHKEEEDLQSNITKNKSIMVLNTEWTQLETIELLCEASGGAAAAAAASSGSAANATATTTSPNAPQSNANRLAISSGITASPSGGSLSGGGGGSGGGGFGFGITGNKSTGVVVKALTPGGYAQRVNITAFISDPSLCLTFIFIPNEICIISIIYR